MIVFSSELFVCQADWLLGGVISRSRAGGDVRGKIPATKPAIRRRRVS